jgi:DNA-binding NarL/FixJ family response regulator
MGGSGRDGGLTAAPPPVLVVADDRPVLRAGLAALLHPFPIAAQLPFDGLADAIIGIDADLLIVGIRDDDASAFAAVAGITSQRPDLRVVAVADSATVIELREAVIAGIDSFLLTSATHDELHDAVVRTHAGERVVAPSIAMQLATNWRPSEGTARAATVTPQELEVLSLAANGLTNERIAAELGIGARTVKTRIQNVLAKLEVPDRTAAVARALRLGLIS